MMDRREFLKHLLTLGALGSVMGGAVPLLGVEPSKKRTGGRAKSIIELWIWGGPSHIESFDPKPNAGRDFNGGRKAIPTNVDGIYLSEFMPKLAQQADKFSIIRSMTHPFAGHEMATYLMQTGRTPGGGITYPAIGALLAMLNRGNVKYGLPPYVALTTTKGRFAECGFLGDRYAPFATGGNPNDRRRFVVEGYSAPGGITVEHQQGRFRLGNDLDLFGQALRRDPALADYAKAQQEAKEVMFGKAAAVFDPANEPKEMREKYGYSTFGQACLVARRLVEAGVPYITINASGWDTHKQHFEALNRIAPPMDQAVAALLEDLHARHLLDTTLVWWSGEFGRTPQIDWHEPWQGGRNHYSKCFSAMVAGGGFAGGRVVGSSNETATQVVSRPVTPSDLFGSFFERCGLDPRQPYPPNKINLREPILPLSDPKTRLREIYLS